MSTQIYRTASAPEVRLPPRHQRPARPVLEDLDIGAAPAVSPDSRRPRVSLLNDLKLLFAALGAGGSVVPLGDNRRAARLLAGYAESLQDH
jgi:hypothetical protein